MDGLRTMMRRRQPLRPADAAPPGDGISIVIRALNEGQHLGTCLQAIGQQVIHRPVEVVLVDSGSTDATLDIAQAHGCRIETLAPGAFSFGRALNLGVRASQHPIVVSLSAHCVPADERWLSCLVAPLLEEQAAMAFGSHVAPATSRSSEMNYFAWKYRGPSGLTRRPLMNNGNAAFLQALWRQHPFDEALPAQEDMAFCQWHQHHGQRLFYVAEAQVTHHHNDRNHALYRRLYRELAVEFHLGERSRKDFFLFLAAMPVHVVQDLATSRRKRAMLKALKGILAFRGVQAAAYWRAWQSFDRFIHPDR